MKLPGLGIDDALAEEFGESCVVLIEVLLKQWHQFVAEHGGEFLGAVNGGPAAEEHSVSHLLLVADHRGGIVR